MSIIDDRFCVLLGYLPPTPISREIMKNCYYVNNCHSDDNRTSGNEERWGERSKDQEQKS
jgi:hypothetical protein